MRGRTVNWRAWTVVAFIFTIILVANFQFRRTLLVPPPTRYGRPSTIAHPTGPARYVNHFIGTTAGGHVFPGATLPWGNVKVGPDCDAPAENQAGFVSDNSTIHGFSPLHDSGTGGAPSLGQFGLLPIWCKDGLENCETDERRRAVNRTHGSEYAQPGYFAIGLESNIVAEMTASHNAAFYRFTWSNYTRESEVKPFLLFDFTDLSRSFAGGKQTIELREEGLVRVTGFGKFRPSFGTGDFKVYFCLDVPHVHQVANWTSSGPSKKISVVNSTTNASTSDFLWNVGEGAIFQISEDHLASSNYSAVARTGISWTSTEKACANAEREIASITSKQFDETVSSALSTWNNVLGTVEVDETYATTDRLTLFWSSLYRSYIAPTNITGDNPLWHSTEPYYDSLFCIWDSFRVVHPLYAITQRTVQAEVVRALIDIYRHEGFLPDCRMSLCKGYTQGGSNADSLLSDSYVKGIRDGINWTDGLAAMVKDAEVTPPSWSFEGRGGIQSRQKYGYVPAFDEDPYGLTTRSASRTLEYAFNDFSIALVAQGEGDGPTAAHYIHASADWRNLWNANLTDTGFKGFIQPRLVDGGFHYQNPVLCSPVLGHMNCFLDYNGGEFYETSSWLYSFYVPHDMGHLVNLMGGRDTFVWRLDTLFDKGYHDIGNEPGFLHCFLYNYGGRPDKSVDRVLQLLARNFTTAVDGLPGNDDSGAMGGFAVFASFGFYPVAGTSVYLLSTPLFKEITFPSSQPGKRATLKTQNFDGAIKNKYIQTAKLNNQPLHRNWFTHEEFFGIGAELELLLGPKPSSWGTRDEDLPPSISTASSLATFS